MEIIGSVSMILSHKGGSIWSIAPNAMVFDAIQLMASKNVGALPVMDGGSLVGIVSERDYTRNVILKGKSSKETPVRAIMTIELVTATPEDTVSDCMALMTEKRVRHLPILDGEELIGMLSIGDVVKWIMSSQAAAIHHLQRYITGEYPA